MPDKYQSITPLPGGAESYSESLLKIISFIQETEPTEPELLKWLIDESPKVTKRGSAKSYADTVLHSGLVAKRNSKFFLTIAGRQYVSRPDNLALFHALDENILGFKEMLLVLSEGPNDGDALFKELRKRLGDKGVTWTSQAQPRWRLNWLRALGLARKEGGRYELTEAGEAALDSFDSSREET